MNDFIVSFQSVSVRFIFNRRKYNITTAGTYVLLYKGLIVSRLSPGEAVGLLLCVLKENSLLLSMQSKADKIFGSLGAQPSVGRAHVVATVLSNPANLAERWVFLHLNEFSGIQKMWLAAALLLYQ